MTTSLLPAVLLEPPGKATHSVIWLHGLGADGNDFVPIVPELGLHASLRVRFVFPHAPIQPVTLNGGMRMRAWYDITELNLKRTTDEPTIRANAQRVRDLIAREQAEGIPSHRIALAGFSQGGALALFTGLRHPDRLAGILGLSCYLLCADSFDTELSPANRATPVFLAHGSRDPVVPVAGGEQAHARLQSAGVPVEYAVFPMQHEVCWDEIRAIGAFLNRCFEAV